MASLKDAAERQAFSLAIDAALKSLNKDREKALLNIVNLVRSTHPFVLAVLGTDENLLLVRPAPVTDLIQL